MTPNRRFATFVLAGLAVLAALVVLDLGPEAGPPTAPKTPTERTLPAGSPDRCPEDAVFVVTTGSCTPGDDFPVGSDLHRASQGLLAHCPVGTAVVSPEARDIIGWCR